MTLPGQLSVAEAQERLAEIVDVVERDHRQLVITDQGRPVVVIMSVEDLAGLEGA